MDKDYTIEEIEKMKTPPEDGRVPHVPFGFQNQKWLEFKSQIQPGDKIHDFSSSEESWENLAGRAGYILVREGRVIDTFVTIMN
jgi:hypothetical protein